MSAGLYPMQVIAEFLGKRVEDMSVLIREDGLPVIMVPAKTRNVSKVSLLGLHRWITARSQNIPLTVDELEIELDRAAKAIADRLRKKAEKYRKAQDDSN